MDTKETGDSVNGPWDEHFDERQIGIIQSCRQYVADGAPGLPGHQLMLIVAKMAALLDAATEAYSLRKPTETD